MEITLTTDEINELRFRQLAGLCVRCGKSRSENDRQLCCGCQQKDEIEAMEKRWARWDIAA